MGNYSSDKKTKLPLTEWDSQGSHSTISKAALAFKTLTIAFPFYSGSESHRRMDDRPTLEAARSWLSDLSRFKHLLKLFYVWGVPVMQ